MDNPTGETMDVEGDGGSCGRRAAGRVEAATAAVTPLSASVPLRSVPVRTH